RRHPGMFGQTAPAPNQGQPFRASAPPQSLDDDTQIPAFSIGDSVLADLLAALPDKPADIQQAIDASLKPHSAALPDTRLELRSGNSETRRGGSLNAVGLIEGSDPALKSETILITA